MLSLRQRNTYHGNSTHAWVRSIENSGGAAGPPDSCNPSAFLNQDSGSHVAEIVESSRRKARTVVDAAMQVGLTIIISLFQVFYVFVSYVGSVFGISEFSGILSLTNVEPIISSYPVLDACFLGTRSL